MPCDIAHWFLTGSAPEAYDATVDRAVTHDGGVSARLSAAPGMPNRFGTLMQTFSAEHYLGQRLRLRAWVRAEEVERAVVWLRVDGADGRSLRFDNMSDRPVCGTCDWTAAELVLDVPPRATAINFGLLLAGASGAAWIAGIALDTVGEDVAETGQHRHQLPDRPSNLDFSL